jgi:phosphoribosylanthranilate isomerase
MSPSGNQHESPLSIPSRWPPQVQIAGVSTLEEALYCHDVGVDALGFTLELPTGIHDDLTTEKATQIISQLPPHVLSVVITYLTSAREAVALINKVGAAALQFHGEISDNELRRFREEMPQVKTIARITVSGPSAIADAVRLGSLLCDALILDSFDPATGRKGATGLTHDWGISARIVQASQVPVILAGGLTPKNVAEAIKIVRPDGVDAHTGVENPDGSRNFKKIEQFTRAAHAALRQSQSWEVK